MDDALDEELPRFRDQLAEQARLEAAGDGDATVLRAYAGLLFAAATSTTLRGSGARSSFAIDVQLLCSAGYPQAGDFADGDPMTRLARGRRYDGLQA